MLTDARIRSAKPGAKPVKLTDGKGLYLEVRPTGVKLWRYRYRIGGKENLYAVGEYPAMGLAEAREERERARKLVKQGIHPAHERKLERIRQGQDANATFKAVLTRWLEVVPWSASTKANRMTQIDMHLLPTLGALPIRQITSAHVLEVLEGVEKQARDTRQRKQGADTRTIGGRTVVTRLRQIINGVFGYAIGKQLVDSNPVFRGLGSFKPHRTTHKTPLTREQIGAHLRAVDDYKGHFLTQASLQLLWLSLARPSEVAEARWSEFDLEKGLWTIPSERMKMRDEHIIPLPVQAIDLLKRVQAISGHREVVFPHRDERSLPMGANTMNKAVKRLGLDFDFTPHAVRTTASTLLNEMGYRPDVIEKQLAHTERNSSRRPYNRATYLDERRVMMQQWADMLDALKAGAKVTPIRKNRVVK